MQESTRCQEFWAQSKTTISLGLFRLLKKIRPPWPTQLKDKRLELLSSSLNKPSGMFCTTTQSRKLGCRSSHTQMPSVTKCGLLT
jgi:hypothetical protein